MSVEKTDTEKAVKHTKFTENDLNNKNQKHYRYGTLFPIINLYKYMVCSFERFKNIKYRNASQKSNHSNVCQLHYLFYSFKMVLRDITSATSDTVHFLQSHGILQHDVSCPGPCIKGSHAFPYGQKMMLKKTNDSKDEVMWRCRKKHKVSSGQLTSVTKDVKLSIRHQSWLVDTKVPLPIVCELMYL